MRLASKSKDVTAPPCCLSEIADLKSASNQVGTECHYGSVLVPHSQIPNLFKHLHGTTFWIKLDLQVVSVSPV